MAYIGMVASNAMIRQISQNKKNMQQNGVHLSGGERIKSAKESASGYQISERMRVMIRSLGQCGRNTDSGTALLATAEGGMQQATELLKKMRELSVQAANGIYTDADMRAMNDEYQQCMQQIDDIASGTTYNGMHLLDGSLAMHKARVGAPPGPPAPGGGIPAPPAPSGVATFILTGTTYTINGDGEFVIPAGFSGDIIVKSSNVLIKQANSNLLKNVSIQCDTGTNLFIEDLNIQTINDTLQPGKSVIDFNGAGNTLNLKGSNTIKGTYSAGGIDPLIYPASLVHVGVGAEVTISADSNASLDLEKVYGGRPGDSNDKGGAVLGGNANEGAGTIIINSGDISVKNGLNGNGAAIGGGTCFDAPGGTGGNITINGGNITASAEDGAAIGSGLLGAGGNITINGGNIVASIIGETKYGAAIGGGSESDSGNITITGGTIVASAIIPPIGAGDGGPAGGNITIQNGSYTVTGTTEQVGRYPAPLDLSGEKIWGGFAIQTGTRSNQVVNCHINDIRSEAIGVEGTHLLTQAAANRLLGVPPDKGALDTAIDIVLSETTRIGAYQMRLAQAKSTLTAAEENTTAAQSIIRDADMAQEMTDYMKNSILAQSAQAMLAQANQAQSGVLELLK